MFKIAFFFLFLSASTTACADSISTAINIVEGFEKESGTLLDKLDPKGTPGLKKAFSEERVKAVSELKTLGWTHAPGEIRFRRTSRIVDSYTGRIITAVEGLDKRLPASAAPVIKESVKRLADLKRELLTELKESRKNEIAGEKELRPVPLIDRSPFDTTPGEAPGIWYR